MKKYIILGMMIVGLLLFGINAHADNITTTKKTVSRASLQSALYKFGFDVERNGNLLLERLKLQEEKHSKFAFTQLYRFLNRYSGKKLVHKLCKVGTYKPLGHDFYREIGGVIPSYNTIKSYKIGSSASNSTSWSQEYVVGTGDIELAHDNCGDQYAGKDDKPANCSRRMWNYFTDHEFEITACK